MQSRTAYSGRSEMLLFFNRKQIRSNFHHRASGQKSSAAAGKQKLYLAMRAGKIQGELQITAEFLLFRILLFPE